MEQGRLTFQDGEYLDKLFDQMLDFPNPLAHDDMIDSLAYIDQIARVNYHFEEDIGESQWEPLDPVSGM